MLSRVNVQDIFVISSEIIIDLCVYHMFALRQIIREH